MRSPIQWFGGKGSMSNKLLKYFPEHTTYVEVFGGGASLLFAKPPSKAEVYNDLNSDLVNLFNVIKDETKFNRFYRYVELTPYSREIWRECGKYKEIEDDVERACAFFIRVRQSFSGLMKGWSYSIGTIRRNMSAAVSKYLSIIEDLPDIHKRLMIVQVENRDFKDVLKYYDKADTFFYLDPPYMPGTRIEKAYECEMTVDDHIILLDLIKKCTGMVLLSGYDSELYNDTLCDWHKETFETKCTASLVKASEGVRTDRTECLWMNYNLVNSQPNMLL